MENLNKSKQKPKSGPTSVTSRQVDLDLFEGAHSTHSTPTSAGALNMTQLEKKLRLISSILPGWLKTRYHYLHLSLTGINPSQNQGFNTQPSLNQSNLNNSTAQTFPPVL